MGGDSFLDIMCDAVESVKDFLVREGVFCLLNNHEYRTVARELASPSQIPPMQGRSLACAARQPLSSLAIFV